MVHYNLCDKGRQTRQGWAWLNWSIAPPTSIPSTLSNNKSKPIVVRCLDPIPLYIGLSVVKTSIIKEPSYSGHHQGSIQWGGGGEEAFPPTTSVPKKDFCNDFFLPPMHQHLCILIIISPCTLCKIFVLWEGPSHTVHTHYLKLPPPPPPPPPPQKNF